MVKVNYKDTLSYEEWELLHEAIKQEEKQKKSYYAKQKAMGGLLVVVSVLLPLLLQDITASIILLPLGVGVMVTKDRVI